MLHKPADYTKCKSVEHIN